MSSYLRTIGILFVGVLLAAFAVALAPGSVEAQTNGPTGPTAGVLAICKETLPDGDTAKFNVRFVVKSGNINGNISDGQCFSYALVDSADEGIDLTLLERDNLPAGWKISDVACAVTGQAEIVTPWSINSNGVVVKVQDVTTDGVLCTFTNEKGARVQVKKIMESEDASDDNLNFDFTLTLGSFNTVTRKSTDTSGAAFDDTTVASSQYVAPGTYTLSELKRVGYDVTAIDCGTPDLAAGTTSLTVAQGDVVTCTFTNTARGEIIVEKKVVTDDPDYMGESFDFTFTPPAPTPPSAFSLMNGETWPTGFIVPGTYAVAETPEVGWETTVACLSSDGVTTEDPAAIDLNPGETVVCTFTNTLKAGKIRIVKQTLPDGDPQTFDITIKDPAGAVVKNCPAVGDDGKCTTGLLNPGGGYKASEVKVPGWDLEQNYGKIVCSNGSKANNIIVDPGKLTVCTFTNVKRAKLTVHKSAIPEVAGAAKTFDFTLSGTPTNAFSNWKNLTLPLAFQLNGGGMWESDPLLKPGTYSVVETPPAGGWFLQSAICHQAGSGEVVRAVSDPSSIYLGPGAEVSCTFTNINPPPANLKLSRLKVPENKPVGTLVGYLTASDPGDIVSFALSPVDGTAATAGNNFFQIVKAGSQWKLLTKVVFDYERQKASSIVVEATDSANNVTKKQFVISILNVRDPN